MAPNPRQPSVKSIKTRLYRIMGAVEGNDEINSYNAVVSRGGPGVMTRGRNNDTSFQAIFIIKVHAVGK